MRFPSMPKIDSHPHEDEKASGASSRRIQHVSIPAVFGVLLFVIGAIAFGIWGPRMGQRVLNVNGHPLGDLIDAVIQNHAAAMREGRYRDEATPLHHEEVRHITEKYMDVEVAMPDLTELGWTLCTADVAWSDLRQAPRTVELIYTRQDQARQEYLLAHLLIDPEIWLHFDALGRQVPLTPHSRIDDARDLGEGFELGISVVCLPQYAVVVTSLDPKGASEVADAFFQAGIQEGGFFDPENGSEIQLEGDSFVFSGYMRSKRRFQPARMNTVLSARMNTCIKDTA